ncbi:MmcQ/YjbR family DNA-binding protein [Actinocatenispora rupis]|uniref:YjbR protein n=1 Tax=Actinocatenispora rupis TaxID=519421 RepID=A0A8J3NCN4_9ACTN|nr:MmcQ/YjbR family DNA-binding protein [Actinocatenispora rupis]GID12080.1 hypothetical protein Aru02nite_29690 [Actinocatenispora rupis]
MSGTDDVRQWATALPEVEESSHFRFHVPVFKVRGRTFLGMGRDGTTAVFCIAEERAAEEAAADPGRCTPQRRPDARRSFLGLEVRLDGLPAERLAALVTEAWRQQAPKRLVAEYDRGVLDG